MDYINLGKNIVLTRSFLTALGLPVVDTRVAGEALALSDTNTGAGAREPVDPPKEEQPNGSL
ncbi:hypothetical protein ACIQMR_37305 [Streptomyces sp. NPDC091376]|uniref:hypothetical protein n=1 Tax=Streptomyces sp. NPDC091376 TaxID=3365994 RepID=UPI003815DCC7